MGSTHDLLVSFPRPVTLIWLMLQFEMTGDRGSVFVGMIMAEGRILEGHAILGGKERMKYLI